VILGDHIAVVSPQTVDQSQEGVRFNYMNLSIARAQEFVRFGIRTASIWLLCTVAIAAQPIKLHPDNPHYFLWKSRPTILITSGEHYGAVINLDFDYVKYLDALKADRLNCTRTWAGAYLEACGNFGIADNTLAPAAGRFICPWARSSDPGYVGGGNKFDLNRWDDHYFARLQDFVRQAGRRGIVVEMNLFCPMYEEGMWNLSPMNARNNINGVGDISRTNVYTLDRNGALLEVQEAMVRKIMQALKGCDNVYYEICNEPYFGGVTMAWQHHIADVITDCQRDFRSQFLISQNVANGTAKIEAPHPKVSIFNFHYASPPDAVAQNYDLNKVIGDNETGFKGTSNAVYRIEAWNFIIAGGGLFNHLDYSFTAKYPDGTWTNYPASQPGGGNPTLRKQFRVLRDFVYQFDFVHMKPGPGVLASAPPSGTTARALAEPGRNYAIYLSQVKPSGAEVPEHTLKLRLPSGSYRACWVDPQTGKTIKQFKFRHTGEDYSLAVPPFTEDLALALFRK
jgi:hypothetical protein